MELVVTCIKQPWKVTERAYFKVEVRQSGATGPVTVYLEETRLWPGQAVAVFGTVGRDWSTREVTVNMRAGSTLEDAPREAVFSAGDATVTLTMHAADYGGTLAGEPLRLALVGPRGCGKSTAINTLATALDPSGRLLRLAPTLRTPEKPVTERVHDYHVGNSLVLVDTVGMAPGITTRDNLLELVNGPTAAHKPRHLRLHQILFCCRYPPPLADDPAVTELNDLIYEFRELNPFLLVLHADETHPELSAARFKPAAAAAAMKRVVEEVSLRYTVDQARVLVGVNNTTDGALFEVNLHALAQLEQIRREHAEMERNRSAGEL